MKILDWFNNSIKRPPSAAPEDHSPAYDPQQWSPEELWFSLCDDPNQTEALPYFLDTCRNKGGTAAVRAALEELTLLENSWLPQIYLARVFLEEKKYIQAQDLYLSVLERPASLEYALFTISADLGQYGFAHEMPGLIAPLYDVDRHNVHIGLNLLQAYRDTGNSMAGQALLQDIRRYDRDEIHEYLEDFEHAYAVMQMKKTSDKVKERIQGTETAVVSSQESMGAADKATKQSRPIWVDVPLWRHEYPAVNELLPTTNDRKRVGVYMYADTNAYSVSKNEASDSPAEPAAPSDLSVSLPVFLGERLLFTTHYAPIVLIPVVRDKGPFSLRLEPDIQSLFALCAQESLDFIVTGTVAKDGDVYRIRTWILDKSKQSARIVAKDLPTEKYGEVFNEMIEEIMILFFDRRYAPAAGRTETFTCTNPLPDLVQAQMQGMRALLFQHLVRGKECDPVILPDEKLVLDMLAYLCDGDPGNQMYFMSLFSAMKNNRYSGSKIYQEYRAALFQMAEKNRYAPCVKALVSELNELLRDI